MATESFPIITLLSDFGLQDPYVGIMKGVMLGIAGPHLPLVDLTHSVPPQDVAGGLLRLEAAVPFFPVGTIHLAVVDPGVGSDRRPVVVESQGHLFVGPDNGLFTPFIAAPGSRVYLLAHPEYRLSRVSRTFHGRDVFAPAAAWLARGVAPSAFGPEILEPTVLERAPRQKGPGFVEGRVVQVDVFGNLITDINEEDLAPLLASGGEVEIRCGERAGAPLVRTYASSAPGALVALLESTGHLELAVNGGSAAQSVGAGVGDRVQARVREGG